MQRTAATYGFQGPILNGWHNPVDHPDYLAYLERRGLPRYEITDKIRGVMPNGSDGNLMAARLRQPAEATFEHYLADATIEMMTAIAGSMASLTGTRHRTESERLGCASRRPC